MKNNTQKIEKLDTSLSKWKTVGVRIRISELALLNKQLDRLNMSLWET